MNAEIYEANRLVVKLLQFCMTWEQSQYCLIARSVCDILCASMEHQQHYERHGKRQLSA